MLFTEARFLIFFLIAFAVYWTLPRNRQRKVWLLVMSYLFYAAWDWRFVSLILFSTAVDFITGRALGRPRPWGSRKLWMIISLTCNLGLLGIFKYFNFFMESALTLLQWLGLPASAPTLQIILPVGISFYTFQSLSYTIDIYRGKLKPVPHALDFALFVGFFPQLVAGPIVRASDFLPQLTKKQLIRNVPFRACFTLFLFGYIKKACVADNIAQFVDSVFASPEAYTTGAIWLSHCLYTVQVYCDFSGYSDMAIASAGFLGYRIPLNFDFPLFARSITLFWKRWHISLSSWFRDYLFIPLGGSRAGQGRTLVNLVIVFFLCGLWHGARWNFVIFGMYHGLFLVLERIFGFGKKPTHPCNPLPHLYTLFVLMSSWAYFRTPDLSTAHTMFKGMFGAGPSGPGIEASDPLLWGAFLAFALVHAAMYKKFLHPFFRNLPDWVFSLILGAFAALALSFAAAGFQPFIYFQF